ncbi:hypothetical protein AKJ38_02055 [candidate division MSBL1 archaeon SCGC-AAA259I14]|uniref:Uncharacterized protein n=1 Tax=candidate division MSBL1 archaeon SCGC-AAA259I14 TaxID=1698268 RepID=A0A133USE4_9EURY|nr:hypothetical protein AKJ38_02055 [candidate division MSBL1 archaeon SCGC-AAA259I14]
MNQIISRSRAEAKKLPSIKVLHEKLRDSEVLEELDLKNYLADGCYVKKFLNSRRKKTDPRSEKKISTLNIAPSIWK